MRLRVNQVCVLVFVDAARVDHADEAAGHREGPHLAARHPPAHIEWEAQQPQAKEQCATMPLGSLITHKVLNNNLPFLNSHTGPPVCVCVELQDVSQPPDALESCQHVDDVTNRGALDREASPGHGGGAAPLVGGDVVVLN